MNGNGKSLRTLIRRYRRDDDGSMVVFTLFILAMMLMVGGLAVDIMRFESYRARLQATLDRSVLAAADLDICFQGEDVAEAVVNDYVLKAGFIDQLQTVEVTRSFNSCGVAATAEIRVNTIFMQMVGVDQLSTGAGSGAFEAFDEIEISLVLDISGSMRFNDRIGVLRPAASEFVETVLEAAEPGSMSINLVPYAGQTNPGPVMFDYLNAVRYPQPMIPDRDTADDDDEIPFPIDSSCIEMPPSGFDDSLPTSGLDQTPMFMYWDIAASVMEWGWCPPDTQSILYSSESVDDLTGLINNMPMSDGTGTHYAMRWAVALLNPSSRPAFEHLSANGVITDTFISDRPLDYGTANALKFIVLMTDGKITEQVRPSDPTHELNPYVELQDRSWSHRTTITSSGTNVNSFYDMCNDAKDDGIVIFTIAFEAPSAARTQMANCASSASHYYNVSGLEIGEAFRSIASQINNLRLTQ